MSNRINPSRLSMRNKLAVAAVLLLATAGAQACQIWRDEQLGLWRGDCNLADFKGKYYLQQHILDGVVRRPVLKMPNLQVHKFKFSVLGTEVLIEADIENIGDQSAGAAEFAVTVDIGNPLTGLQQGFTLPVAVPVAALAAGTRRRVYVGTIFVPNNQQDWDLNLWGVIDPPTAAQPVRGQVIESDETNNTKAHTCRWFGPTQAPGPAVQPCN